MFFFILYDTDVQTKPKWKISKRISEAAEVEWNKKYSHKFDDLGHNLPWLPRAYKHLKGTMKSYR